MKYQFIPEHNIIVSDERAKEGNNFNFAINKIEKLSRDYEEHSSEWNFCRKIIAGIPELPQIDYNGFEEKLGVVNLWEIFVKDREACFKDDKELWLRWESFPKTRTDYLETRFPVFEAGFKAAQALNKKKYTEEDLQDAFYAREDQREKQEHIFWEDFIKSLSQPKPIDIELEMDFVHTDHVVGGFEYFPKIINNSVKIIKLL